MRRATLLALLFLLPSPALADIYMWRDAQGVKHYTNSKALLPAEVAASVVLEEPAHPQEVAAPPAPAEPPPRRGEEEQAAFDQAALAAAFAAGWQQGLASAQQLRPSPPAGVQFNAPLAVVSGGGGGGYGPSYGYDPAWLAYNYPALVTTSFDNGRSRHLTLRMLMQDQFAIDREGPYLIVDRFPPLGPNLGTILPRGLPFFVRPGSELVNRVLTH